MPKFPHFLGFANLLPSGNPLPLRGIDLRGYTPQLFLFILLPITLLVLVVAIGSQNLHHDAMSALVGDRNLRAVRAAAASLEQEINARQVILGLLARELDHRSDLDKLSLPPRQVSALFDGGIALLDPGLQLIAQSGASPETLSWALPSPASPPASSSAHKWPGVEVRRGSRGTALVFSSPNELGYTLIGVVWVSPLIKSVTSTLVQDASSATALLVVGPGDQEQEIVVIFESGQPDTSPEHLLHHAGVPEVMSGQSGILYDHAHQQGEHVTVYTPIPRLGWGLVVEEPWEAIASPALRSTQLAPLVTVPLLLLSVVALWYGAQSIVQPLNRLEQQSAELARGDFEAVRRPVGGIREIQNLQAALIDMAEKLYAARQSLHNYIGAMTAGIENERRSLARELHDDTIQSLIALNQRIQLAGLRAAEHSASFTELQGMVQQTMLNLRRLIRGLRPIYLEDLGLVTALHMLVQETHQSAGLPVHFSVQGEERRLPPDQEMSLYRMTQESLNNVIHHAGAPQAEVILDFTARGLFLTIRDQGKGFTLPDNPSEFSRQGHFGLLGLQERAELIGAALQIHSAPGQGTSVHIYLPLSSQQSSFATAANAPAPNPQPPPGSPPSPGESQ